MKIESPVFGSVEVSEDKIIEFPAGLPGFESCKRFALAHEEGTVANVLLLQSLDDPAIAFSLTAPESLGVNYEMELTDDEVALLSLTRPEDVLITVIVRKDDSQEGSPATAGMRANFMAPVVINVAARRGLQKVINRLDFDITLRAQA